MDMTNPREHSGTTTKKNCSFKENKLQYGPLIWSIFYMVVCAWVKT